MNHVAFRIGPLERKSGSVNAYFVYPGRAERQAFFGTDDHVVLAEILAAYDGAQIACEPPLAAAAQSLGLTVRALTPDENHRLGLVTFDLVLPSAFDRVARPRVISELGLASARFHDAQAWNGPHVTKTLQVSVTGSVTSRLFGRLLGSAGGAPGLALYRDSDAVERMLAMVERDQLHQAVNLPMLGVTLEDAPPFARDAMLRAYGLPCVPLPIEVKSGERTGPDDVGLLTLAAALRAVSAVGGPESKAEVTADDLRVEVAVTV